MGVLGYMPHTDTYISDTVCFPSLSLTPYDDQRQAVDELTTRRSGLLHASTGTGKTLMACMIAKKLSKRTLIIVKDLTLLGQMVREIQKIF
jgi:superfamily II DNA or RNA helicase